MTRSNNVYLVFMSIEIYIEASRSLKTKRQIIKSIMDKLRSKFNLSVAEIDYMDQWQRALLGLSMISNDQRVLTRNAAAIENLVREVKDIELLGISIRYL